MTQEGFAALLGISRSFLSEIESGTRHPSQSLLMLIEARFQVSLRHDPGPVVTGMAEARVPYHAYPQRIRYLLDAVIEVMQSDSKVEKEALTANIEAFVQSVRLRKKMGAEPEPETSLKKSGTEDGEM